MDRHGVGDPGHRCIALYRAELGFGFASMPAEFLLVLLVILVLYIVAAEMAKKLFYEKRRL